MRITVMLTARADGTKCKPFVLLPRVRPDSNVVKKFSKKLELCWRGTIWMNDETTVDYLNKIIGTFGKFFGKRLLVWDSFRSHISKSTKKLLKELDLDTAVIPGGCTGFIQVYINIKVFNLLTNFSLLTFVGMRRLKQRFGTITKIGWHMVKKHLQKAET